MATALFTIVQFSTDSSGEQFLLNLTMTHLLPDIVLSGQPHGPAGYPPSATAFAAEDFFGHVSLNETEFKKGLAANILSMYSHDARVRAFLPEASNSWTRFFLLDQHVFEVQVTLLEGEYATLFAVMKPG